jgi:hypothetical protein
MRAGDLLIEAKGKVKHGQWLPWLAEHCSIAERTAQLYMRLARSRPDLESNPQALADLTVEGAAKMLAAPRLAPDPEPDIVSALANYLPTDGQARRGALVDRAMCEIFVIAESKTHPGYYHVHHLEWPEDFNKDGGIWTSCKRPIRQDFIKSMLEFVMRCGIALSGTIFRPMASGWASHGQTK